MRKESEERGIQKARQCTMQPRTHLAVNYPCCDDRAREEARHGQAVGEVDHLVAGPPTLRRKRGRVSGARWPVNRQINHWLPVWVARELTNHLADHGAPSRLVRSTNSTTIVSIKIFVKLNQVTPMGILLEQVLIS